MILGIREEARLNINLQRPCCADTRANGTFLGWRLAGGPISSGSRLEIMEFMQSYSLLCVKLNDEPSTANLARYSLFILLIEGRKTLYYKLEGFFLFLPLPLWYGEQVFLILNPVSLMGSLGFCKSFWHLCGLFYSTGHFLALWCMYWEACVDFIWFLGLAVACRRPRYNHCVVLLQSLLYSEVGFHVMFDSCKKS